MTDPLEEGDDMITKPNPSLAFLVSVISVPSLAVVGSTVGGGGCGDCGCGCGCGFDFPGLGATGGGCVLDLLLFMFDSLLLRSVSA